MTVLDGGAEGTDAQGVRFQILLHERFLAHGEVFVVGVLIVKKSVAQFPVQGGQQLGAVGTGQVGFVQEQKGGDIAAAQQLP